MKAKELRDLTYEELLKKESDLQEELFNLRFRLATGQLDNPMELKSVKKDMARVKTVIRQMDLDKAKQA
ncbi:MAG: 50S ribosomal protein L29 [Firmicutes bacterium]|nr:50S ribosomal protein L29 [Bacillota bacterium]